MRVRSALLALAACSAVACGGPGRPRNVVVVSIDTLRADAVGAYGGPVATPTLDGLARDGVLFEEALAPAPETAPSHVTLFTGQEVQRHGVTRNGVPVPPGAATLAQAFQRAGYATGGFASSFILDARFGWARGFDVYDATFSKQRETLHLRRGFWSRFEFDGFDRRAGDTNDAALAWLASAPEPFFLFVHYFDPHAPYAPPHPLLSRVPAAWAARVSAERIAGARRERPRLTATDLAGAIRSYQAEVLYADAELGRLLAGLEAKGVAGRTLVAVTADHGEGLGQHGTLDHAPNVYQEQLRVPLVLRWPDGLRAGARVATPTGLVDLAPTLAELAGLPAFDAADGRSHAAALRAGREPEARPVLGRRRHYERAYRGNRGTKFFVQSGRFKYVRATEDPDELYDLTEDPAERSNAIALHPDERARLSALLDAHLARTPDWDAEPFEVSEEVRRGLSALGYAEE